MTKLACSIIALSFRYHSLIIPLEILVNASESVLYREVCLDKKWPSWHVPLFFSFHIYSHQWSITLNIWRKTFVSLSCFIQNKQHQKTTEGYISKYTDYKLWENFFALTFEYLLTLDITVYHIFTWTLLAKATDLIPLPN